MNPTYPVSLRRAALLLGMALVASASLSAQQLTWTGGASGTGTSLATATNWAENSAPTATSDLYIANNPASANTIPTLLMGANHTVRSFIFDNAAARYGSIGLRIVSTTATNSTAARVLTFGTAGTIITASNNTNASFRSASLSGNSTATPLPSLTVNLNFSGTGTIDVRDTSIVLFSEGSANAPGAVITGTGGLAKTGAGTLRMNENHTYSGGFELSEGSLLMSASTQRSGTTVVSGPFGTGTITLSGGAISGTTSISERTIHNPIILNGTVTLFNASAGGTLSISSLAEKTTTLAQNSTLNVVGSVVWNQTISGDKSLTKTGDGTLRLNGANLYTGLTSVQAGTLNLTGSIAGALEIDSGASLQGSGTVGGAATIAGIHNPGNSPGIQTFASDLTYNTGASVNWELNGNTSTQGDPTAIFDQVVVGDTLNFAGSTSLALSFNGAGSTVDWSDAFWSANQSWKIYDAAAVSGFGNLSLTTANWADASGDLFDTILAGSSFSLSVVGTDVYLNYAAIPEPATYAALLGLAGLALVAWRRRAQQG